MFYIVPNRKHQHFVRCCSGCALSADRSRHAHIVWRGGIGAVERSLQVRVFARARALVCLAPCTTPMALAPRAASALDTLSDATL